jgi:putative FmdB family regulatory protein
MPLYEFECLQCKKSFEELVRSTAAVTEVACPNCGSPHIRRKVSIFASKGSGSASISAPAASCAPGGG